MEKNSLPQFSSRTCNALRSQIRNLPACVRFVEPSQAQDRSLLRKPSEGTQGLQHRIIYGKNNFTRIPNIIAKSTPKKL
jgi:hypothetical protein